jgi:hypothetical protein
MNEDIVGLCANMILCVHVVLTVFASSNVGTCEFVISPAPIAVNIMQNSANGSQLCCLRYLWTSSILHGTNVFDLTSCYLHVLRYGPVPYFEKRS